MTINEHEAVAPAARVERDSMRGGSSRGCWRGCLVTMQFVTTAAVVVMAAALSFAPAANAQDGWCSSMRVTGYSEAAFSGQRTRDGTLVNGRSWTIAAVDPRIIPLGATVTIPELGLELTARDTGGGVLGHHIDVLVPTNSHAYALTGRYTVCIS